MTLDIEVSAVGGVETKKVARCCDEGVRWTLKDDRGVWIVEKVRTGIFIAFGSFNSHNKQSSAGGTGRVTGTYLGPLAKPATNKLLSPTTSSLTPVSWWWNDACPMYANDRSPYIRIRRLNRY